MVNYDLSILHIHCTFWINGCSVGGCKAKIRPWQEEKGSGKPFQKGKPGLFQVVLGLGCELLNRTENIIGELKQHFKVVLNLASISCTEGAES